MINPNENIKITEGKVPLQLIDPRFEELLAGVLGFGAAKYGTKNYLQPGLPISHYIGAIRRHLNQFAKGEDIDPDSGFPHIMMIASNAHVMYEIMGDANGPTTEDDRLFLYRNKERILGYNPATDSADGGVLHFGPTTTRGYNHSLSAEELLALVGNQKPPERDSSVGGSGIPPKNSAKRSRKKS